jgi:two-component system response regulator MtrA
VATRVLLVEDDASLRESVHLLLERHAFSVVAVPDGPGALEAERSETFDAIVLDLMLPGIGGFDVCREIRKRSSVPIVMLTARAGVADVVAGLELGADDYVTKPFEPRELVARLRAAVRRGGADGPLDGAPIVAGAISIDLVAFRARLRGVELELTATEFRLLAELARNPGRVLTREVLLERVWGYDYLGDSRLVDMAVGRLRAKLEDDPRQPTYVLTVRGVGYRFEPGQ